jgi:hypothetical protein
VDLSGYAYNDYGMCLSRSREWDVTPHRSNA